MASASEQLVANLNFAACAKASGLHRQILFTLAIGCLLPGGSIGGYDLHLGGAWGLIVAVMAMASLSHMRPRTGAPQSPVTRLQLRGAR